MSGTSCSAQSENIRDGPEGAQIHRSSVLKASGHTLIHSSNLPQAPATGCQPGEV